MTPDAKRWEKDARADLRAHHGELATLLEPSESYQIIEAAARIWAIRWPGEPPRRLPASFSLYSLQYQRRYGHQLPEWAPHLDGVFEGLGGLRDELRRLRAGGDQGLPMADYESSLGISPG